MIFLSSVLYKLNIFNGITYKTKNIYVERILKFAAIKRKLHFSNSYKNGYVIIKIYFGF